MPTYNETLRVRGTKLDASDTYIDVTVTDYALSGHVRLAEEGGTRTWSVSASDLQDWQDNDDMAVKSQLADPTHTVWTVIEQLDRMTDDQTLLPAESELDDLVDSLYSATIRAQQLSA